jgi:hypothetical protein
MIRLYDRIMLGRYWPGTLDPAADPILGAAAGRSWEL